MIIATQHPTGSPSDDELDEVLVFRGETVIVLGAAGRDVVCGA